jgi:hypothetical protein
MHLGRRVGFETDHMHMWRQGSVCAGVACSQYNTTGVFLNWEPQQRSSVQISATEQLL